jgi:hypothetical protein
VRAYSFCFSWLYYIPPPKEIRDEGELSLDISGCIKHAVNPVCAQFDNVARSLGLATSYTHGRFKSLKIKEKSRND